MIKHPTVETENCINWRLKRIMLVHYHRSPRWYNGFASVASILRQRGSRFSTNRLNEIGDVSPCIPQEIDSNAT